MQSSLFVSAPNLIGDIYRNHNVDMAGKFHRSIDFIDISPDGLFLLGTSDLWGRIWAGAMWVFNDLCLIPDTEKCLGNMDFDTGVSVGRWFQNGTKIAVGTDSGSISILAINTQAEIKDQYLTLTCVLCDHEDGVTSLDVAADNTSLVTGSRDMSIKIYNVESIMAEKSYSYAHSQIVNSVSFMPGRNNIFVSASGDGDALLWDARQEKPASLLLSTEAGFTACNWLDDNTAVLGANSGVLQLVDVRQRGPLFREVSSPRPIHYLNVERSSQLLAMCADDPVVKVYDCSKKEFYKIYESDQHDDFVRGLCWSTPNRLYSSGYGMEIVSHDIKYDRKGHASVLRMGENGENGEGSSANDEN